MSDGLVRYPVRLLACLVICIGLTGCAAIGANNQTDPPAPVSPDSLPACGAPAPPTTVSSEYLFAPSIFYERLLYVYQIDPATGAATQLPWSPITTYNIPRTGTPDPSIKYLYVASSAGLNSNNTPYTIETFSLAGLPAQPPASLSVQPSGSSDTLIFDPQGKYFYTLDPYRELNPPADGLSTTIQAYTVGADGQEQSSGAPVVAPVSYGSYYAYKSNGNLMVFAHGSAPGQPYGSQNGITTYRESCSTGQIRRQQLQHQWLWFRKLSECR